MSRRLLFLPMLLLLLLAACGTVPPPPTLAPVDQAATQQAIIDRAVIGTSTAVALQQEIDRLQTEIAVLSATPTEVLPLPPTETPVPPTETPVPTVTLEPTATATLAPTLTFTPLPPTLTPLPTATTIACNLARFEADITVPDGSTYVPNTAFVKTWRLKNTGACTWTTSYDLVFTGGDQMSAPSVVDLPANVAPGQVIDISVPLTAPSKEGSYRGNWKLRDAGGLLFGIGQTSSAFYVDIKVKNVSLTVPFNFAANACLGEWSSGAGRLACPSPESDSRGFVYTVDRPKLETGTVDDEAALVTSPQMVTDGVIRGKFPAIRVESGYRFKSVIGCAYGFSKCDVKFQLDYQVGDGAVTTLATWNEKSDDNINRVDVDLSALAGKDVKFILTILANGVADQDRAQWLAPRIEK